MSAARTVSMASAMVALTLGLGSVVPPQAVAAWETDDTAPAPGTVVTAKPKTPTIVVDWHKRRNVIQRRILGTNYHYSHSSVRVWDKDTERPVRAVVAGIRRSGVELIRYPGGTTANLFDWKSSIGDHRSCQIDAHHDNQGLSSFKPTAYGLDEHMTLAAKGQAGTTIMVPFINETPNDAAAWVEYMNTEAGPGNPNGGVDWADRRAANGHRAPYNVKRWEIGNEQRLSKQRFWMSDRIDVALRQYVNGARPHIRSEALGKHCEHPTRGVRSDGSPGQVFDVLYPPIKQGSAVVEVNGGRWRQVANLSATGPGSRVFKLHAKSGEVFFGDGDHGRIPKRGAVVKASYTSIRSGVFSFIRAMRRVDRSIDVCPSWGTSAFVAAAQGRRYDCFTSHAYTNFSSQGSWKSAVQGHDLMMLGTDFERHFIARLRNRLPNRVELPLSEFGTIWGDARVFPSWPASMSHALYMATQWVNWTELGIPWATGGALTTANRRGVLGPPPKFVFSANAAARQVVVPLFEAGGRRVTVHLRNDPVRVTDINAARVVDIRRASYPALKVLATRGRNGDLYLLVINRLPQARGDVTVRIELDGFTSAGKAFVRSVSGTSFKSWNGPHQRPVVKLKTRKTRTARHHLTQRFAAHSVTVLHIPKAR